jgi:ATP-binding cassette subfamily B (MDR/TAP) protein 1
MKIKNGTKVAFVGTSGCGKSTIIQLLQRFYDIESPKTKEGNEDKNKINNGRILINGIDIKDYDIHYLRHNFGVVSQEPVLFNGSFK